MNYVKWIPLLLLLCGLTSAQAQEAAPVNATETLRVLASARMDLELLAQAQLADSRPLGWSGSLDITDPQLVVHIRLDLELLAAQLVGQDTRPPGWFGAQSGVPYITASDIRHDLELLADMLLGLGSRPSGWSGGEPIMRCARDVQQMAHTLAQNAGYAPATSAAGNFCVLAAEELQTYAQANPDALTTQQRAATPAQGGGGGLLRPNGDVTYSFLDRYATQRTGIIPQTESFTALARSYTIFSRMTLVRGDGFEVFVDWKTTTLTEDEFLALPNVNTFDANPTCTATWCRFTLTSGIDTPRRGSSGGGALVSGGTNMRIYYDADVEGGVLVRMEVCRRPTRERDPECATATQVILPDGSPLAPVNTVGGMPQFLMPYGYHNYSVRSACCYTDEVYISYLHERR